VQLLPCFLKRCFSTIEDALFLPQKGTTLLRPLEASGEQDEVFSASMGAGLLHLRVIGVLLLLERWWHAFSSSLLSLRAY
jgi:hypothetical protein